MYAMHEAGGDQPTTLRDDATPPRQQRAQGGNGTTLYVPGLADERAARNGCTSAFLSSGSIADAHIKNLKFISDGHFTPQMHYMTPRKSPSESRFGSSAFAAKVDDRYSYLPKAVNDPMSSFYSSASPTLSNPSRSGGSTERPGSSQQRRPSSPTAAFRSRTPIACAHQNNPRPVDPHFMADDAPQLHYGSPSSVVRVRPTSSFRTSADRDSYIKAQPQVLDSYSPLRSDFDKCRPKIAGSPRESTSSFRSKASIGDAHIRALNRPVDVCVSYVSLKSANH